MVKKYSPQCCRYSLIHFILYFCKYLRCSNSTQIKVLDNHVIDYIPPEILMEKSENLKKRTKDGLLGMAIVGAMSSDPRLVN